jgi:hypothetical protein
VRGDVRANNRFGVVFLDDLGLVARIERHPGRLRARPRAWVVTDLAPNRNLEEDRHDHRPA